MSASGKNKYAEKDPKVKDIGIKILFEGQGIGRASCLMLAREGASVIATDINTELLESLQKEADTDNLNIKTVKLDVTNKDEIQNVTDKIDKVDVLFNCAGYEREFLLKNNLNFLLDMFIKAAFSTAATTFFKRVLI